MTLRNKTLLTTWQEIAFQIVLHILVFLFYAYNRNDNALELNRFVFFLNSAVTAGIINYFLFPKFFYKEKYSIFFLMLFLVLALAIINEEFVLEQIFFADSRRSKSFPGVFFTLVEILPTVAVLSGFKFTWDAIKNKKQVEKLSTLVKESELQFLKSQINPHFLFNNLNNLYSYAIEQSPKTPSIILELSSVLRYMLYECKAKYVPLTKEIEHLKNFTELNKLQIENRGVIEFSSKHINPEYKIAPLILVVFIENAFKHSQTSQSKNIKIDVNINMRDNILIFNCKNNYKPTGSTQDDLTHGIGLKNVKKRLDLLYKNNYKLDIKQSDVDYEVSLTLTLHKTP
jgi:hypothetical protein